MEDRKDSNLVRFGLMWGLYDLVGSLGRGWLSYS